MEHNLAQCRILIEKAVAAGAKVIRLHAKKLCHVQTNVEQALFLPEASDYISSTTSESISLAKPLAKSPFVRALGEEARRSSIEISVGVHAPANSENRVRNLSIWFDEQGCILRAYQKLHLFDIDIKDGPRLKESELGSAFFHTYYIDNIQKVVYNRAMKSVLHSLQYWERWV